MNFDELRFALGIPGEVTLEKLKITNVKLVIINGITANFVLEDPREVLELVKSE